MQTVSVSVRYESLESLGRSWNRRRGTLAVANVAIRKGARVLLDGTAGEARFLVGGEVEDIEVNGPSVRLHPDGRAEVEALLGGGLEGMQRTRERWPVQIPGILSGRDLVRCADLSIGGARLIFGKAVAPPVGSLVHLALFPCDAPVIPAPILATIAWRSPDGRVAGCSFQQGAAAAVLVALKGAVGTSAVA